MISLVFIISTIYFTLTVDKQDIYSNYVKNLTDEQLVKYKQIVNERKNISVQGYLLGLALSACFILLNYNLFKINYKLINCVVIQVVN